MILNKFNILFIVSIFIFLIIFINKTNYSKNEYIPTKQKPIIKYIKCNYKTVQDYYKMVFEELNMKRINESRDDWDLYLPCGYNYIEEELLNVNISNENQFIFGIKGCDKICSKNQLWKILENYYGRKKTTTLIPETYIINNPKHIDKFKLNFNKNNTYYLKKNIQRKEGILITNNYNRILNIVYTTNNTLKQYHSDNVIQEEKKFTKNQKINTLINSFKIIQKGIENLYLVRKRKLNIRMYVVIVCRHGIKEFYLYKKGKCIYANKIIDDDILDKEVNLTSYHLDKQIYANHPETLQQLKGYMKEKNYNILYQNILDLFKNVFEGVENEICNNKNLNKATTFQLFGCDIIFNTDLHPYLLEFNKGPSMKFVTRVDKEMKLGLLEDVFKISGLIKEKTNNFIKIK
jgi:hypothetical protein